MKYKIRLIIFLLFIMLPFLCAAEDGQYLAKIVSIEGVVLWHKNKSFYWEEIKLNTELSTNDILKTAEESYCEIMFKEGHVLRMEPNSEINIQSASYDNQDNVWKNLKISVGKIWVKLVKGTNEGEEFTIKTKYVSISKQDALFAISAPTGKITTYEGELEVVGNKQKITIKQGYETVVDEGGNIQEGTIVSDKSRREFQAFSNQTTIKAETMKHIRSTLEESIKIASENELIQAEDQEVYYETEIKRTFIKKIMDTLNKK